MLQTSMVDGFDIFTTPDDQIPRKLNLMVPEPLAMPPLTAAGGPIDRHDWRPTNRLATLGNRVPRYDQGRVGKCESTTEIECMGVLRAMYGASTVRFSTSMAYALVNGGVDRGVPIGRTFAALQQFGCCLESSTSQGFLRREDLTSAQYEEARNYCPLVAMTGLTFEDAVTAHLHGCAIGHGVVVGERFGQLDAEGRTPDTPGLPNHAVMAWDLVQLANGQWGFLCNNHWGLKWGMADSPGNFIVTEDGYRMMSYGNFVAYKAVSIDLVGLLTPPPMLQVALTIDDYESHTRHYAS